MTKFDDRLCAVILKMKKKNISYSTCKTFRQLTTFRCGGKIALTLFPHSTNAFIYCLRQLKKTDIPYLILGNGSNILASDKIFYGAVVVTQQLCGIKVCHHRVQCLAGTHCAKLFNTLARFNLCGGEFLACLPATVGGATVMNAGCFGGCMSNIVRCVTIFDGRRVRKLQYRQCNFGKRTSIFLQQNLTVLQVELQLSQGCGQDIMATALSYIQQKQQSQPLNFPSAGSVFYHDSVAVSKLIDQAGLKGFRIGGAAVSQKHAGFIINVDKAESNDIYLLIQHIMHVIKSKYGICPHIEVQLVNF